MSQASGPDPNAPPETTTIRLYSFPPVNCIAPQFMAERFLREEGFTELHRRLDSRSAMVEVLLLRSLRQSSWMEKHPVATKRALRAMLKAADLVAKDPEGTARHMVDCGYTNNFDEPATSSRRCPTMPGGITTPPTACGSTLRLKEAGIIRSTPEQILKRGADFRYLQQLKKELQTV